MSRKARAFRGESDPVLAHLSAVDKAVILGNTAATTDNGLEYVKRVRTANVKALGDVMCPAWFVETQLEVMKLQAAAIEAHTAAQAAKLSK